MKSSLSLGHMATILLSVSPLASAWGILPAVDSLVVRQDNPAPVTDKPKETGTADPKNGPNLNTGKVDDASPTSGSKSNSTAPKTTPRPTFDSGNYPASIVMLEPASTAASALYSMGQEITFSWNYTGLLATPTALDILATGQVDKATYTLAANMSFPTAGSFRWDTRAFQAELKNKEMMTEKYNLLIYDSEGGPTASGEPGYLMPFSLEFGLYKGMEYRSKDEGWFCSSCSAGMGEGERRAIGMAVVMSTMTVLGFTWFVTGSLL